MYLGNMVEKAASDELFAKPLHPYTQALLSAIPVPSIHVSDERIIMQGEITSPVNPKPGCRFMARCQYASEVCSAPQTLEEASPGHIVACCKYKDVQKSMDIKKIKEVK
jgi:oligopeptide/dipeptide ABC transporter ATP-binding protein